MIVNGILLVLQGVFNILLAPLSALNIGIDLTGGLAVIAKFLQVIFYILPMDNFIPIIIFIVSTFSFRIGISAIKTLWNLLPIV